MSEINVKEFVKPERKKRKVKSDTNGLLLFAFGVITVAIICLIIGVYNWSSKNEFKSESLFTTGEHKIIMSTRPIWTQERKPIEVISPIVKSVAESMPALTTDIEKYICTKFGAYECKVALAVAKAESGMKEDRFHINTNGTIDYGIFQINSVHFNQPGCSMKELVDQFKNVDCAYSIWKASGWNGWSAFSNGSFQEKL